MKPTLVIVGRPNVGKSTLFNRMTQSRAALVADFPGLTRDRHYGQGKTGDRDFLVVDTGGFEPATPDGILKEMAKQTLQAIAEADVIIFLLDGREGLTSQDRRIGAPMAISSAHGEGVRDLVEIALEKFPDDEEGKPDYKHPRIAVVGRPNVGKSTLINTLLGEERMIAFDQPGTTRDSIYVDFERDGKQYTLIDTAGIRRRGKVFEAVEKFSVIKTLQAVADANVVILVLDAHQEISDQDAHIAGFILEEGRALVVAINKWDDLDDYSRERIKVEVKRKLSFLNFARQHFISALQGAGIPQIMKAVDEAYAAAMAKLPTPKLTQVLAKATQAHQPPQHGPFRPRLKYAHQGGSNPPLIIIHGTAVDKIGDSYKRFLENRFREAFQLSGTPLRVEFRQGANPFDRDRRR
jgi:GTPase